MTDRTAAALASALPAGINYDTAVHAGTKPDWRAADIAAFQAERLAESGWRLVHADDPSFAEHTAKAISRTVGSTGNSTGPHIRTEFIHDHVEAGDE
jgi:hypothetical protein